VNRVLGIELRRSAAPWMGVALVVGTLGLTLGLSGPWVHGPAWNEHWLSLAMWQRYMLIFSWPFVVGVSALHGARQRRSRMDELLASTARPAWQRVAATAGAVALSLVAGQLVLLAVGGVQVAAGTGHFDGSWVAPALVGLLALVAGASAGMAIGRLLPSLVTPPVLAAATLALIGFLLAPPARGPAGLPVHLLSPHLTFPSTPFTGLAGSVDRGQAVVFAGLAAAGFLALTLRRRARPAAALPLVLAVAAGLVILPAQDAYPVDPDAIAPVCADGSPRVCVTRANQDLLDELAGVARPALAAMAVLPNAPTSVQEIPALPAIHPATADTRLLPVAPGALPVDISDTLYFTLAGPLADLDRARRALFVGAGTLPCGEVVDDVPDAAARLAVVSWFDGDPAESVVAVRPSLAEYVPEVVAQATAARDALFALPRAEQVRRVAALREAALSCRGGLWEILVAGHT
jgi:hypothetical protein